MSALLEDLSDLDKVELYNVIRVQLSDIRTRFASAFNAILTTNRYTEWEVYSKQADYNIDVGLEYSLKLSDKLSAVCNCGYKVEENFSKLHAEICMVVHQSYGRDSLVMKKTHEVTEVQKLLSLDEGKVLNLFSANENFGFRDEKGILGSFAQQLDKTERLP